MYVHFRIECFSMQIYKLHLKYAWIVLPFLLLKQLNALAKINCLVYISLISKTINSVIVQQCLSVPYNQGYTTLLLTKTYCRLGVNTYLDHSRSIDREVVGL